MIGVLTIAAMTIVLQYVTYQIHVLRTLNLQM